MVRSKTFKTLDVQTLEQWRNWLADHHDSESEVWLVFHKRHTGRPSIAYQDALDEALCFGWVDSLIKRLDDARYARKFTPRKADSKWSAVNRKHYARLKASGRLKPPGLNREPTDRSYDARPRPSIIPVYIQEALQRSPTAWRQFRESCALLPAKLHRLDRFREAARNEVEAVTGGNPVACRREDPGIEIGAPDEAPVKSVALASCRSAATDC